MSYEEEVSDLVHLGKRLDNALLYIQSNEPDLVKMFYSNVEIPFIDVLDGTLDIEQEDYLFDYLDGILDDLENTFNQIFENKIK